MKYFAILGKQSGKALDANRSNQGELFLWDFNGGDNQLWFWDGELLRNKHFPNKVLDFHWMDYQRNSWGKVYLHDFNGGLNQKWQISGEEIITKHNQSLRLDVYGSGSQNGTKVGCFKRNRNSNQKWIIQYGKHFLKMNFIIKVNSNFSTL